MGRQHGILNSLEVVLKTISHLISEYLPKILQILLCMTATVSHILEQREKVRLMVDAASQLNDSVSLGSWVGIKVKSPFVTLVMLRESHRLFRRYILKPLQCFE